MNKVIATITKMTIITALLLAVSPQAYAGNMSFDNLYPNAQLSENIEGKISSISKDKKKDVSFSKMEKFYKEANIQSFSSRREDNSMGWDSSYGDPYYETYSSDEILSYIIKYNTILEKYGYSFYTEEMFWAHTYIGEDCIGLPPAYYNDHTGPNIKGFLENSFSGFIKKEENKKKENIIVVLKYSSDNLLPYDKINIKIDKKKKVVSFWHSN